MRHPGCLHGSSAGRQVAQNGVGANSQADICVRHLAFAAVSGCCRSTFPAFAEALLGDDQKDLFANDW